jgi:hypothetical protein
VVLLLFDLLQQQQAVLHAVQALAACSVVLVFTAGIQQCNAAMLRRLPCPGWCQLVSLLQHLIWQQRRTAEHRTAQQKHESNTSTFTADRWGCWDAVI